MSIPFSNFFKKRFFIIKSLCKGVFTQAFYPFTFPYELFCYSFILLCPALPSPLHRVDMWALGVSIASQTATLRRSAKSHFPGLIFCQQKRAITRSFFVKYIKLNSPRCNIPSVSVVQIRFHLKSCIDSLHRKAGCF